MIVAQYSGLWAREGNTFLNAQTGQERNRGKEHWLELRNVRLYEFDDAGRLESIAHAGTAEHRPGGWLLHNVKRTYFDARAVTQTDVIEERWESKLDDTALAASVTRPESLPSRDLRSGID
jgi:lipopolysaccharide export system permease protein